MNEPRLSRTLVYFGTATLLFLAAIRFGLGQKALEKIATVLVMPCGVIWYLMLYGIVLSIASGRKKLIVVSVLTWSSFTLVGSGFLSTWLSRDIEAPFVDIDPLQQEPFDLVIVLGGGAAQGANGRQQGNSSGDRLILAAELYHADITKRFICTGRRIVTMNSSGFDPAQQSAEILERLGVPMASIELAGGRTTAEEMQTLAQRFQGTNQRIGLVTSAWHLRRALRLASKNGLDVQPLPADFMSGPVTPMTIGQFIMSCIPRAEGFYTVARIAKEHLGMLVGR